MSQARGFKGRLSLAQKFYLTLLLPLLLISGIVSWLTYRSLDTNASELADALRLQGKTNRILPLLLAQDDASKAILIDPTQLEFFSDKKISSYDEYKKILLELEDEAPSPAIRQILLNLATIDETHLRPVDTKVLEMLYESPDKARALYFTDYEPHRLEYEKNVRELVRLGAEYAEGARVDMATKNIRSLLQIVLALALGIGVVAVTIRILSRQVEKSEENTRSLLAVLREGLFFFDREGKIAAERSQSLAKIIPGIESITDLVAFTKAYTKVPEENVSTCLKLLWNQDDDDFMSDFDSTITFLPRTLSLDGTRTINLSYRPLYGQNEELEKVVVVATDVTEQLKSEKEALIQAERVRKISRVAAGVESYLSFFEEAIGIFRRADAIFQLGKETSELVQLKRDLHTLKGSLGTFEFTSLARQLHELESQLAELGPAHEKVRGLWELIKDQWKFETSDIEAVLGLKENKGKLSLAKPKLEKLFEYARSKRDEGLAQLLQDCLRSPLREVFAKYEAYLGKLMERRSEKQVRLTYTGDSSELSYAEMQRLDAAFVHIIRNCMDHGIEDKDLRQAAHKANVGMIEIACYRRNDGSLHFIVRDDGQGVNGDKLALKAVQSGLWTQEQMERASFQEKVELVFAPNLSSKDEVTETSGRGVGMDAVKNLLEGLGGKISIFSQPGVGTQFEIDVPPLASDSKASVIKIA